MKKKILALLCALSVLAGLLALTAAAATPEEEYFMVGYARVDINPYEMDANGNIVTSNYSGKTYQNIMPVPLRGLGSSASRLAYGYLMDDNGDGVVNGDDGLALTCIAITDSYNNTILFFTMDAIGDMGHTSLARNAIVTELGAEYGITADRIMVSGTHAHSSVDLTALSKSLYSDTTADVTVKKYVTLYGSYGYEKSVEVAGRTAFDCLNTWRERLTGYSKVVETDESGAITKFEDKYTKSDNYFVQAAEAALKDRSVATVSKGQIEADESGVKNADKMNFVRHYVKKDSANSNHFVMDSYSNTNVAGVIQGHIAEADQTLHAISFSFDNSNKEPIVLVNWRNHPQFSSSAAKYIVSSDYISAYRYQMKTSGYRAAFFQGTGGNTQPTSRIDSENWTSSGLNGVHQYGKTLADVTKVCLKNNMKTVAAGEVQTMQKIYAANRVNYSQVKYNAALAAIEKGEYPYTYKDPNTGEAVCITCDSQASKIKEHYENYNVKNVKTINLEIDAILIGPEIAIVTCPGEPFDRYSLQAAADVKALWNDDKTAVTYSEYYAIANKYNDWDNLAKVANAQYGEPLIFGYTNQHITYIPNALAYNYNAEHPELYSTNSYGSFMTPLAEGEGEKMVANLATMLDQILRRERTYCEHCKKDVSWHLLNDSGFVGSYNHYYLTDDYALSSQMKLVGRNICLNLNGYTLTAANRVFVVQDQSELNIMDSSAEKNGKIVGVGAKMSGGAISVDAGGVVNIYGGEIYCDNAVENSAFGGVIYSNKGAINIYGGQITGSGANNKGGAVCLADSESVLRVYGGRITAGTAKQGGACVASRNSDGVVILGADAQVDEIVYLAAPTADNFQIVTTDDSDVFFGSVVLNAKDIADGAIIGTCAAQWAAGDAITISNGPEVVLQKDGKLVAQAKIGGVAAVVNGATVTPYSTLAKAIANVGTGYVILGQDVETLEVSKNIIVDLNGKHVTNAVANNGATLTIRDRKTADDYVGDHVYGIVGNISGNVVAMTNYLTIAEETGTSYHHYSVKLKSVTLSTERLGIYYTGEFLGDNMVKEAVDTLGIALNISEIPDENNMEPRTYSVFSNESFGGESPSTILLNIMKPERDVAANTANANIAIYGRPYMKLKDGRLLFGDAASYSLKGLTELVSKDAWESLDDEQISGLVEIYRQYSAVMSSWDIENIKNAYGQLVGK